MNHRNKTLFFTIAEARLYGSSAPPRDRTRPATERGQGAIPRNGWRLRAGRKRCARTPCRARSFPRRLGPPLEAAALVHEVFVRAFSRSRAASPAQRPCRTWWFDLFPVSCGLFGAEALPTGVVWPFPESVRGSWGRPGSAKGAARAIKKARRGVRRALRGVEELSPRGVFQACGPRWPGGWCPGCGVAAWGA